MNRRSSLAWGLAGAVASLGVSIARTNAIPRPLSTTLLLMMFFAIGAGAGGYFAFSSDEASRRARLTCALACAAVGAAVLIVNLVLLDQRTTRWFITPTSADPAVQFPPLQSVTVTYSEPVWWYAYRSYPVAGVLLGLACWLCIARPRAGLTSTDLLVAAITAALWALGFWIGGALWRPINYLSRGAAVDAVEAIGITPWLGAIAGAVFSGFLCGSIAGAIAGLRSQTLGRQPFFS